MINTIFNISQFNSSNTITISSICFTIKGYCTTTYSITIKTCNTNKYNIVCTNNEWLWILCNCYLITYYFFCRCSSTMYPISTYYNSSNSMYPNINVFDGCRCSISITSINSFYYFIIKIYFNICIMSATCSNTINI